MGASGAAFIDALDAEFYPTPVGSAAAYYPETNVLIPLDHHGAASGTPASKSIAIRLEHPSPA